MNIETQSHLEPEILAQRVNAYYANPNGIYQATCVEASDGDEEVADKVGMAKDLKALIISDLTLRGLSQTLDDILETQEKTNRSFPQATSQALSKLGYKIEIDHETPYNGIVRKETVAQLVRIAQMRPLKLLRDTNFDAYFNLASLIDNVEGYREMNAIPHSKRRPTTDVGIFEYTLNHMSTPSRFASIGATAFITSAKSITGEGYRTTVKNSLPTLSRMAAQNFHTGVNSFTQLGVIKQGDEFVAEFDLHPDYFEYNNETDSIKLKSHQGHYLLYKQFPKPQIREKTSKCPAAIFTTKNVPDRVKEFVAMQLDTTINDPVIVDMDSVTMLVALNLAFTRSY